MASWQRFSTSDKVAVDFKIVWAAQRIGGNHPQGSLDSREEQSPLPRPRQGHQAQPLHQRPRRERQGASVPRREDRHSTRSGEAHRAQRLDHHRLGNDRAVLRPRDQHRRDGGPPDGDHLGAERGIGALGQPRHRGHTARWIGAQHIALGRGLRCRAPAGKLRRQQALHRRGRTRPRVWSLDDQPSGGQPEPRDDLGGGEDHRAVRFVEVRSSRLQPHLLGR